MIHNLRENLLLFSYEGDNLNNAFMKGESKRDLFGETEMIENYILNSSF